MSQTKPIVIPERLQERFALAYQLNRVLLLHAPCGCGKTEVAKKLLRAYRVCYLSAAEDNFSLQAIDRDCEVLLIDDLHLLTDSDIKHALCERIRLEKDKHFVFLTRGAIPGWLMPFQFAGIMESFGIEDLFLDKAAATALAEAYGVSLSYAELGAVLNDTNGYPVALAILLRRLSDGGTYGQTLLNASKQQLFMYFDEMIFCRFEMPLKNLLLEVAPFENFNVELAKLLSGGAAGTFQPCGTVL